jgi:hypothetical protein
VSDREVLVFRYSASSWNIGIERFRSEPPAAETAPRLAPGPSLPALLLEPSKNLACVLRHSFEKHRFAHDFALEGDGFELPVRERRAMAPSHGFAAASHREAALRGAPASHGETAFRGAAGFREARRRRAVHPSRNAPGRKRLRANRIRRLSNMGAMP